MSIFRRNAPSEFGSTVSITGTISADGVSSGSLDGGGSYIGLNSSNQFVLTAAGGSSAVTALNNATANELVTVGATITELDAESNLTFDGTTLQGSTLHVSASSISAPGFVVSAAGAVSGASIISNTSIQGLAAIAAGHGVTTGTIVSTGANSTSSFGGNVIITGSIHMSGSITLGSGHQHRAASTHKDGLTPSLTLNGGAITLGGGAINSAGTITSAGAGVSAFQHYWPGATVGAANGVLSLGYDQYILAPTGHGVYTLANESKLSQLTFSHYSGQFNATVTFATTLGGWTAIRTSLPGQGYKVQWNGAAYVLMQRWPAAAAASGSMLTGSQGILMLPEIV